MSMVRFCLDLSKPLPNRLPWARAKGCSLLFDGEVYHPAGLDAAGLLDRYLCEGPLFVTSLNGKFIVIVHDSAHHTCHVIRDRVGECCAYYSGNRVFNYVRDAGMSLSWRGTAGGPECTCWNEISQVPPAHILTIDLGTGVHRLERYWNPWVRIVDKRAAEVVEELREVVADAIHIRSADAAAVVVGGLDTAIVAGIIRPRRIFSFYNDFSEELSDVPYVKAMARHLRAPVQWGSCSQEEFRALLPDLLLDTDILLPFNGGHLIHNAVGAQIRAALPTTGAVFTGTGGDDLFGYMRTAIIAHELRLYGNPYFRTWHRVLDSYYGNHVERLARIYGFDAVQFAPYCRYNGLEEVMGRIHLGILENMVPLETLMIRKVYARHGLETRSPLLDHRVVELAFSYNKMLDYEDGGPKSLLRAAFAHLLPPKVRDRTHKVGHSLPVKEWLGVQSPVQHYRQVLCRAFCSSAAVDTDRTAEPPA
jgi:asparagine synthase (glutamine-hydrolysing)